MSKIVGITIKNLHLNEFSNGATQHIYTMAKFFQLIGWKVVLIYSEKTIPETNNNHMNLPVISRFNITTSNITFNLILFFEWYENGQWIKDMRGKCKCPIVKYQAGNMYENLLESFLKNEELLPLKDREFQTVDSPDRIWLSPHYETRGPVYDVLYNTKTVVAPYMWDSFFIDRYIKENKLTVNYLETQKRLNGDIRIAICEPNRDIQKCSLVPLIGACSGVKRGLIQHVGLFDYSNSKQQSIATVMRDMGCFGKQHRKKFIYAARRPIPDLLQEYSMIVSHQNDCMLNYLYLEVAYLGFPIIHNSPMCKDIGYYYEEDNVDQMLECIEEAKKHHHTRLSMYCLNALNKIQEYSVQNKDNITTFKNLLQDVGL